MPIAPTCRTLQPSQFFLQTNLKQCNYFRSSALNGCAAYISAWPDSLQVLVPTFNEGVRLVNFGQCFANAEN
jgi:hypothetical protein